MSETNKKLHGENTSTTRAFHELERKEMVKVRDTIEYRGRKFSKYWLSGRGIGFVLLNGANAETTKNFALGISSKDKPDTTIESYFRLRSISPKIAKILDESLVLYGTLSREEMIGFLLFGLFSAGEGEKKEFFDAVMKSKDFGESVKEMKGVVKAFLDVLGKIEESV